MYFRNPIAYMVHLKFTNPISMGNIHRSLFNFAQIFCKSLLPLNPFTLNVGEQY